MSDSSANEDFSEEEDLFEHHRIVADEGQRPLRVDKFLLDRVPNTSRNRLQLAAKNGYIHVNGTAVKQNYKVKARDVVTVELPHPVREVELTAEDIPLEIFHEDDDLVIVNKAAGMVVHPGVGNYSGTLVNAILHHFGVLPDAGRQETPRPGLVHRLDKNTTGLMVLAKTDMALTNLSEQFFERSVDRRYHALVWGDVKEDGTVTGHIGRSLKDRKLMSVFEDGESGKHAVTHYRVLRRYGYVTLVECKLETGRTHQIRAHMKHIGHPVFGDTQYGGDKVMKGPSFSKYRQFVQNSFIILPRQALHAKSLALTHPVSGERLQFESELPNDIEEVLEKWERYAASAL